MEDYNKIIESLGVRYIKAKSINVKQPVTISNFYDVENTAIFIKSGKLSFENSTGIIEAEEGEVIFIPGGKKTKLTYGSKAKAELTAEEFVTKKELYLQSHTQGIAVDPTITDSMIIIAFEAKVFNSVNFFASLDIEPFVIKSDDINFTIKQLFLESISDEPGNSRVVKLKTEQLVVEIIRYIIKNRLFVEQLATNSTYFKDPRLIDIFNFIRENINGDLSNKVLAEVANVSEDYVGQYFKMLTGINPQDYIEYQRMEEAVNLLRTSKNSIREIGKQVGYKDTAYFCRRFKMMFGIPAGKMRRRESLMNL
ncbi:Transcriptional regulator, AraC family [hydrothermal vent metagenome]|uniref:Transcriptional regulator, AraC family n=1 Tax=hydrothermal vent metagenome TaxID=652676 RepID=A0A3B0UCX9_9ZZZZ